MKASEIIESLSALIEDRGDLDVEIAGFNNEVTDVVFTQDYCKGSFITRDHFLIIWDEKNDCRSVFITNDNAI